MPSASRPTTAPVGGAKTLVGKTAAGPAGFGKKGGLAGSKAIGAGGGGSGLSSLLASSALLSNLPADSSDSEEEDHKSQKSESKTSVSAFSFKSGSSAGSGNSAVKSAGGLSLKPKMGLPKKSSLVGGGGVLDMLRGGEG